MTEHMMEDPGERAQILLDSCKANALPQDQYVWDLVCLTKCSTTGLSCPPLTIADDKYKYYNIFSSLSDHSTKL